ncbi:MAG: orotidine-5'-phosphate decarboxylase [Desulfosalsimonadaceae bacterium]
MKTPRDYIIFPLDVSTVKDAVHYVEMLSELVGMFKVGLELFVEAGPEIVRIIKENGPAEIFLDLKFHDIPATVQRAMNRAAEMGVTFATVHCGESSRMLEAAVTGGGGNVGVLGVTVLTSISAGDIAGAGFTEEFSNNLSALVLKRAAMAKAAGCAGVVCSGQEVKQIKALCGGKFIAVTPGIRPAWQASDEDQRRIVTPSGAILDGSDYLVIGRPIRDAKDPVWAARKVAEEIGEALSAG